jgi:Holliday junction resolvasome RuvABC endonuclease subunit
MKKKIMENGSVNVLAIDLSYRSTGYSMTKIEDEKASVDNYGLLKNSELGLVSFGNLKEASLKMHITCSEIIKMAKGSDLTIVEVPAFPQSAKSAILIGIMWGCAARLMAEVNNIILIEPSALKYWSKSDSGDGKCKVKEIVLNRVPLGKRWSSSTDVVDAIAIGLMMHDEINKRDGQLEFKNIL